MVRWMLAVALVLSVWGGMSADAAGEQATPETAFLDAAWQGNTQALKDVLDRNSTVDAKFLNAQDNMGWTALIRASAKGHDAAVSALLAAKADVNGADRSGRSALIWAAKFRHPHVVRILLGHGAAVNAKDKAPGWTALAWSVFNGDEESAKDLLAHNATVDTLDTNGITPLMRASFQGYKEIVLELLEAQADVNLKDLKGNTALSQAVTKSRMAVVPLLLGYQANPNLRDNKGITPLMIAAYHCSAPMVKLLLKHNADANIVDAKGSDAINYAVVRAQQLVQPEQKLALAKIKLALRAAEAATSSGAIGIESPQDCHRTKTGCLLRKGAFESAHKLVHIDVMLSGETADSFTSLKQHALLSAVCDTLGMEAADVHLGHSLEWDGSLVQELSFAVAGEQMAPFSHAVLGKHLGGTVFEKLQHYYSTHHIADSTPQLAFSHPLAPNEDAEEAFSGLQKKKGPSLLVAGTVLVVLVGATLGATRGFKCQTAHRHTGTSKKYRSLAAAQPDVLPDEPDEPEVQVTTI
jgi:ankyrin repeat protein